MDHAIEAVALSKRFTVPTERRTSFKERFVRGKAPRPKEFWALKDATFSVPKGSSLGLIGQNGSGKSTALKVLTGIYRPTSGHILVNGSVSALLEVGAGFHPELTGRENIRLNATILGFTNREIDRLMDSIIEFADIGDHIDAPIKHYSSGMYVRLGFAVAVMVRPEILLVDEVIAVGDEEFQRKCYEYLYDLRRAGTSMIIVSHGLSQITELCDDAVWLEHGEVRGFGPSRQVVRSYLDDVNEREARRGPQPQHPGDLQLAALAGGEPQAQSDAAPAAEPAVAALNAESEMAALSQPGTGLPHRPAQPRRGSGEIRVGELLLLHEDGQPANLAISGRGCIFRIRYTAFDEVRGAVFGLGFDNHADFTVGGINNGHLESWTIPAGTGYVEFRATPLLLAGGIYRVRCQVHVASHLLDAIDEGLTITVRAPDVEVDGAYLQPGDWVIGPALGHV